jgi:2'-5' RNA ligase
MQESKTRAFIAVDIPEDIKSRITEISKGLDSSGIRTVGPEQLHITMFFLGYVDARQLEAVKGALSKMHARSFAVDLNGIGTFDVRNPRVVFVSITKGSEELSAMYAGLFDDISALRIRMDERGFTPHITIARLKSFTGKETNAVKALTEEYSSYDFGSFLCTSIKLKQSVLTREGPVYTDLFVKELTA